MSEGKQGLVNVSGPTRSRMNQCRCRTAFPIGDDGMGRKRSDASWHRTVLASGREVQSYTDEGEDIDLMRQTAEEFSDHRVLSAVESASRGSE